MANDSRQGADTTMVTAKAHYRPPGPLRFTPRFRDVYFPATGRSGIGRFTKRAGGAFARWAAFQSCVTEATERGPRGSRRRAVPNRSGVQGSIAENTKGGGRPTEHTEHTEGFLQEETEENGVRRAEGRSARWAVRSARGGSAVVA